MFKHAYILTGGIASGKSTVCTFLKLRGFEIIDADTIAHESFDESHAQIQAYFGTIDRKEIGNRVFYDIEQKKWLENLLHPIIYDKIKHKSSQLDLLELPYIVDIPLFFESKNYNKDDAFSILVYTPKEMQIQRLVKREKMSEVDANLRVNAQMDIEQKKSLASFIIDNSKDITHLQKEIERFIQRVKQKYDSIKI